MIEILPIILASLLGSTAQVTVGFGSALFLSPVMFLLLGSEEAVLCTLGAVTWLSVAMLVGERRTLSLDRNATLGLVGPGLAGVLIGVSALALVEKGYLQITVGVVVVLFVFRRLRRAASTSQSDGLRFAPSALPFGLTAGMLNGAVSTGGPPLAIWLQRAGATPAEFRHTLAVAFVFLNVTTIAAITLLESPSLSADFTRALVVAALAMPLGYLAGSVLLDRLVAEDGRFARAVAIALLAVAVGSIGAGIANL